MKNSYSKLNITTEAWNQIIINIIYQHSASNQFKYYLQVLCKVINMNNSKILKIKIICEISHYHTLFHHMYCQSIISDWVVLSDFMKYRLK